MHGADQRQSQGSIRQGFGRESQGFAIVDDFLNIADFRNLELDTRFIFEDLVDRGLRSLDPRGQNRFAVGERRKHHAGVDHALEEPIITCQSGVRGADCESNARNRDLSVAGLRTYGFIQADSESLARRCCRCQRT